MFIIPEEGGDQIDSFGVSSTVVDLKGLAKNKILKSSKCVGVAPRIVQHISLRVMRDVKDARCFSDAEGRRRRVRVVRQRM